MARIPDADGIGGSHAARPNCDCHERVVTVHVVVALPLTRRGDLVVWELYETDGTGEVDLWTRVRAGIRAGVCSEVDEAEEIDDDGLPHLVHRGEEIDIVEAFARADRNAVLLWHALRAIGLGSEVLAITASLSADNQPVTRLRMTPAGGARLLKWLIASGPAPPHRKAG
jgi:hypothetical protein